MGDISCGGESLDDLLLGLCRYGEPRLSRMSDGWYANIGMHVASEGAEFSVKTDFDHATPREAIEVLIKRVRSTLTDLNRAL